jgi:hypothetical protein
MASKKTGKKTTTISSRQKNQLRSVIDYGIDVEMLIANFNRMPEERIKRHQIALNTMLALRRAKRL